MVEGLWKVVNLEVLVVKSFDTVLPLMMMFVKILLLKNLEGNFSHLLYVLCQNQNMIVMLAIKQNICFETKF